MMLSLLAMNAAAEGTDAAIAVTDQQGRRVVVYSLCEEREPEEIFSWQPTEALGYEQTERYVYPSDVRLRRHNELNTQVLLTCASHGFCAMAELPSGKCLWQTTLPIEENPHAIELLPNGCIAVASSTGNAIRLYAPGSGEAAAKYTFADAHGLLWDPAMNVLWAVGRGRLSAFEIAGTPQEPELVERRELRAALPIANGHDVWPVYGDADRLWVVANAVFLYDKSERKWIRDDANLMKMQGENVKSMGNTPDGVFVHTIPNGTFEVWDTDTLDVLYPGAEEPVEYRMEGLAVYRARIWNEAYQ